MKYMLSEILMSCSLLPMEEWPEEALFFVRDKDQCLHCYRALLVRYIIAAGTVKFMAVDITYNDTRENF